ncbi:MAG: hypothetical protein JWM16_4147, partial [Verrucomicrobiales bacterium]|nr:hypothetical protein [Verrucomicrobiales bacterium]
MKTELMERLLNESECTYHDYKQAQYPFLRAAGEEARSELIKDILAMANARTGETRHIMIGLEEVKGGRAIVHGLMNEDLLVDNDLQQFINSKLNRTIRFRVITETLNGHLIQIIEIEPQKGLSFLKSSYGKLSPNIVYYRIGSSTKDATPTEIEEWGRESVKRPVPELELRLAHIGMQPNVWPPEESHGISAPVVLEFLSTITRIEPESVRAYEAFHHFPELKNLRDYLKKVESLVHYFNLSQIYKPVGLVIKNSGAVPCGNIKVNLKVEPADLFLIKEQQKIVRPVLKPSDGITS